MKMVIYQCFKKIFIFSSILIVFLSPALHAEKAHLSKQQMWDAMCADVDHWTDGLGRPIDKKIKEVVIALNMSGIKTEASCEGHLKHGFPYPWVDIEVNPTGSEKMRQKLSEIDAQINQEEKMLEAKFPNTPSREWIAMPEAKKLRGLYKKRYDIDKSIVQIKIKSLEPLTKLLNQFYKSRKTSYDKTLAVQSSFLTRLQSIGTDTQHIRSEKEKSANLRSYQNEMNAFADFLKEQFMNSN